MSRNEEKEKIRNEEKEKIRKSSTDYLIKCLRRKDAALLNTPLTATEKRFLVVLELIDRFAESKGEGETPKVEILVLLFLRLCADCFPTEFTREDDEAERILDALRKS